MEFIFLGLAAIFGFAMWDTKDNKHDGFIFDGTTRQWFKRAIDPNQPIVRGTEVYMPYDDNLPEYRQQYNNPHSINHYPAHRPIRPRRYMVDNGHHQPQQHNQDHYPVRPIRPMHSQGHFGFNGHMGNHIPQHPQRMYSGYKPVMNHNLDDMEQY